MSKTDRSIHGPSWAEVILGAFLSLVLGMVIAIVALALRPPAKEPAKLEERKPGTVYYVAGATSSSKAGQALAKRKAFLEGQTVTITEEEVNAILAADTKLPAPPPAQKDTKADAAAAADSVATGTANVRIRDGVVQVGAPVTLNVLGLSEKVIVQARGGFAKKGDVFVYDPSEVYVGSLPVQRLPFLNGYVREKILSAKQIPDDIAAAWRKLSEVVVEGNTVRLSP